MLNSCSNPKQETENGSSNKIENPTNKVILSSEIVWEQLNPARGDQSPQAGTIWGDRNGTEATGFLAKFVDGFSSPPHIHNVTYRAVVIQGLVHNDDPKAENFWMKSGSFWTQPAGESHITSAKGNESIALVEISEWPYLVKPIEDAFDSDEKPINIDVSNILWLNNQETNWVDAESNAEISFLHDNGDESSLFVKLPNGYTGEIETDGTVLHAVVISGIINYTVPPNVESKTLDAGSYFGSTGKAIHQISNKSVDKTLIYIRTNGNIKVK